MSRKGTAILIFAREISKELKNKSLLASSYSKEYSFVSTLNKRAEKIAQKSNIPYFIVSSNQQIGVNFQERFQNAIQFIFDKGFTNVISIGNDTPYLTSQKLIETKDLLMDNQFVFGETNKGGVYLFGISKETFENFRFHSLLWQSSELALSLKDYLRQSKIKNFQFSEVLNELNNHRDTQTFLSQLQKGGFLSIDLLEFYRFLSKKPTYETEHIIPLSTYVSRASSFRGPPILK